jgi:hypothetical protein
VFETGPSKTVELLWPTYGDAADECSLSRIYGGIHPPADDIPGRRIGRLVAQAAWKKTLGIVGGVDGSINAVRIVFNDSVVNIFGDEKSCVDWIESVVDEGWCVFVDNKFI